MEVINLNFIPSGANPVAHASQFDEGRTTRFNLFDGSAVYTLDGTEIITVSVRKPDGHIVTESVTNTSSTYVEVVTTEQMTACAGDNLAQIKVEKGGDTIGFLNYILSVQKDPEDGGDPSASFIHDLEQQIAEAVADQYDAADVVFDAVPTAGHGVGFAVTSEGVKNAIPDELDDLSDVTTSAPTSGEALVWDGSKWTNGTVSTVGSIDDLNDVDTTGKAEGDSLRYDSGSSEWVAKPIVIEVTQAEYDQLVLDGDLQPLTTYILTDAPNLNATSEDLSYDGGATSTHDVIAGVLHPTKIWSGSKYTLNDYVDIPDFDKNTAYMFEFMAFSGTYHTCFVSPVGDGYLQFVIWGDSTQHCRYRVQINTNSGRMTIVDVMNGGANQALVAIYAII